ncbi:MAG: S-layer homology domain-containing protein, partial [Lachnospiraceae bacterium]|nr:S-layer homology domain-containing protein [Lachnospiraceae bacterium]
ITMTGKTTYSGLYIGEQTSADAASVIAGTAVTNDEGATIGYSFEFELPASARGTYVRVSPAKANGDPATSEVYLLIPDADGNVTGNPLETGEVIAPANIICDKVDDGVISEYTMFKIDKLTSTITIDGETMTLHFTTTGHSNYSAVYIGGNVAGKGESDAIPGVLRTDGTDGRVFDIELPVSRLGTYVTIRIWNSNPDKNDWVDRTVYLAIPDRDGIVHGEPGDDQFPFSDPTENEEFNTAIMWGVDLGITTGWEESDGTFTFRPWNKCNRAAIVTFLWRMAGDPEPQGEFTFSDPTDNDDFNTAITWAVEQGLTTGWTSDNTFRPWGYCNRAAAITFLWRLAGKPEPQGEFTFSDPTGNEDFDTAITWAVEQGITTGWTSDNTFRPWNTCNRAAIMTFLYRYMHLE